VLEERQRQQPLDLRVEILPGVADRCKESKFSLANRFASGMNCVAVGPRIEDWRAFIHKYELRMVAVLDTGDHKIVALVTTRSV